jgi:hypothetical protein
MGPTQALDWSDGYEKPEARRYQYRDSNQAPLEYQSRPLQYTNLSLCLIKRQATKAYGVEVELHRFKSWHYMKVSGQLHALVSAASSSET